MKKSALCRTDHLFIINIRASLRKKQCGITKRHRCTDHRSNISRILHIIKRQHAQSLFHARLLIAAYRDHLHGRYMRTDLMQDLRCNRISIILRIRVGKMLFQYQITNTAGSMRFFNQMFSFDQKTLIHIAVFLFSIPHPLLNLRIGQ